MSEIRWRTGATPLQGAVIGCGRIGSLWDENRTGAPQTHVGSMMSDPRIRLVALVDSNEDRLKAAQQRWGVPATYADWQQLFAHRSPDVVSICTPNDTHAEILLAAIQAGVKGIWVEKPIASSCDEAEQVLQAATRAKAQVVVNYTRRFTALYQRLKRDLAHGMIGEVIRVHAFYARGLANNGSHAIDLSRFLFGDVLAAKAEDVLHEPGPDPSLDARLVTQSGVNISLLALPAANYDIFEMYIFGTRGRVDLLEHGARPVIFRRVAAADCITGFGLRVSDCPYPQGIDDAFPCALSNLLATCQGEAEPICSVRDGWETLRIVHSLRQSAVHAEPASAT